ncbi:MAG: glycosyltransferase family 2 protein [Rhodobiaceae bacterium]|nr:glycosyltransferase family 2 protein [Rhodobiaceae bacterium]
MNAASKMPRPSISAIIITLDAAAHIESCIRSLSFCDEIIVVDSGSTDGTQGLAEALGAKVSYNAWPGFGPQKQHALSLATSPWIFSIDADEQVPEELAGEIAAAVSSGTADGYEMPRKSHFLGRWMRHSGWWPDHVLRLARREKARFSTDIVHERMIVEGSTARLHGALLHFPIETLQDAYAKINRYAEAGARKMVAAGKRPGFGAAFGRAFWSFFSTYLLKRGFLDGREGLINALVHADQTYQRYLRAWQMTKNGA